MCVYVVYQFSCLSVPTRLKVRTSEPDVNQMWTRIPPTFFSSKEWRHCNVCSEKTSLAAVGYAFGSLHHQTQPTDSSQLNSTADGRLSVRLLCCGCVLHSPSNCQTDFLLPERTWTTQVNSITEKKHIIIKVEIKIKSTISSQLTSWLQRELVVLVQRLSALCGPPSQPGPGLQLGYVGLRLDPPGLTELWGAGVVPMW